MIKHKHDIVWDNEKASDLWNYYASNKAYNAQYFSFHSGRYIIKEIIKHVPLKKMNVLDFGCGPGYLIEQMLQKSSDCKISGLDFSEDSIKQVNNKFSSRGAFVKAVKVDTLPSEFAANVFDMGISIEVIEHLDDDQLDSMILELKRVLKPGAALAVTTPNSECLEAEKTMCPECGCVFHRWQHVRSWDKSILTDKFEKNGFKTLVCKELFFTSFTGRIKNKLRVLLGHPELKPHLLYICKNG